MSESNGAGKGDRPRNNFSKAFRDNWDLVFKSKKNKTNNKSKKKK